MRGKTTHRKTHTRSATWRAAHERGKNNASGKTTLGAHLEFRLFDLALVVIVQEDHIGQLHDALQQHSAAARQSHAAVVL